MSNLTKLLVRDVLGTYVVASDAEILNAARQVVDRKHQRGAAFTSSDAVKQYLVTKLAGYEHEVFSVLFLDNQHQLIKYDEMFRGTINQASIYPREVVKEALQLNAAAVIFSHNHPAGIAEPSSADEMITERLKKALMMVDIRTLDHIIVAGQSTVSFSERGLL